MRPRLQDPRTRILLSRDEQSKNLERIRRTSRNRLARLESSIEAKDNLAERIKTARETNTKAIVLSRSRWTREKKAMRERSDTWASLGSPSVSNGCAASLGVYVHSDDASHATGHDDESNVCTTPERPPPLSPPTPQTRRRQRRDEEPARLHQADQPSPRLVRKQHQRPSTTPTMRTQARHLPWASISDAETGEPLELRRRRWKLPPQRQGCAAEPLTGGDGELRRVQGDIEAGPESAPESDQWRSSWHKDNEGDLVSGCSSFGRKPWLAKDQPASTKPLPNRTSIGTVLLDREQHEHEAETPRPNERLHSPLWMPPPQEPPGRYQLLKLRMRTAVTRTSGKQEDYGKNGYCCRGGGHRASSLSPRQRRRTHADPASRPSTPPLTLELSRHRESVASLEDRPPSGDGMVLGERSVAAAAAASYDVSERARSKTAVGFATDHSIKAMVSEEVSEEVQSSMLVVQDIRDRYLRQVQQMVMEEIREERCRDAALRRAVDHPVRYRYLRAKHRRERNAKQTLIKWIRRDVELIVVQKTAELGLVR